MDNRYSHFVKTAKIACPLLALALLSTLFLFSRGTQPADSIPFADIDVKQIAQEERLSAPRFSGVTADGSSITVQASAALPSPSGQLSILDVTADLATSSGANYRIEAEKAAYDGEKNDLSLSEGVRFSTSNGYEIETQSLRTDLNNITVIAPGPVTGTGPLGQINAGQMELRKTEQTQVLVFKDGVKMIYTPKN